MSLMDGAMLSKNTTHRGKGLKNAGSLSDDIIELNIGGQKMTTLRSTLTAIPNCKLAFMFSKENAKNMLPVDREGAVFFDYNPIYFNHLLDQLRLIKRMPKVYGYQLRFSPPFLSAYVNFTHMLTDLGLTRKFDIQSFTSEDFRLLLEEENLMNRNFRVFLLADHFLSPMEGTHANLSVNSLNGWQECYRSTYDVPFNISVLTESCNGSRLLVACRPVHNKQILTLAGIGYREDILHSCLPKRCKTNGKSRKLTGRQFMCSSYHQCITQAKRGVGWYHVDNQTWGFVRGSLSFVINPCDSSNLDSDYRLCWTLQSDMKKTSTDRCGSAKNLHKSNQWERVIYYIY
ncbi:unnamed protein product [Rotaria magnacalcarata]|uniref:Potassium channel tetramerisation-type BTB domain-containing protein n=3 Tax=Rotaria magnacalcarata TaxID=392030 RepID=A0A815FHB8_9BILA|nr:unnamed protein product [Rotaria magnacalcarata]CAF1614594.1 unnamed protein product [Rotaria magnacalcarata]CAF2048610.1 unnamed protein product [Rotaria magnacalcarata]CAF2054770.1 unnamed protein product [Rotaria magnacalcarata]CAF2152017.1 unnamed protein product [Rotaria magnacalcarata]